jgi:hypothetical protein
MKKFLLITRFVITRDSVNTIGITCEVYRISSWLKKF